MEISIPYTTTTTTPVYPLSYYYTFPVLTDADKAALRAMIREVLIEVLDEREASEEETEQPKDEYWRF